MFGAFFQSAVLSPGRQASFRRADIDHLLLLLVSVGWSYCRPANSSTTIAYLLLTAGIVEGAGLIGWRLAQLPKSRALEFLLASPVHPQRVFLAEVAVGLSRFALVSLSGLPVLVLLAIAGQIEPVDVLPLLAVPFTWGAITGLGLTLWAYETAWIRRWGERLVLAMIVVYLAVGVLAGEHLADWLRWLPGPIGIVVLNGLEASHRYNPFSVLQFWMEADLTVAWARLVGVELAAVLAIALLLGRTAWRMQPHFHDRHYAPIFNRRSNNRTVPGDSPLTWWAVRRVSEYSGRVNLWLAGGFGCLYAAYTWAGPRWPSWLGRSVFAIFDNAGGVPIWATALVILAAVPAAFQYGLWDSNAQDRCRRLELLLLTELSGTDYWRAAAAAAWNRGRGYLAVALLLWFSAYASGSILFLQALAGLAAGVSLWGLYFALGFLAFSKGNEANRLGLLLTIGLPAIAVVLTGLGWPSLAAVLPPGSVYFAVAANSPWTWCLGGVLTGFAALAVARIARPRCEMELRGWYAKHHGNMVLD